MNERKTHELKILPEYFTAVVSGIKRVN
ncbi:DUF3850 domain-containing protein, partial [Enterococcus faecalis]|nr:DUF3850 domain-containing protein [Enterococcus faecalis]